MHQPLVLSEEESLFLNVHELQPAQPHSHTDSQSLHTVGTHERNSLSMRVARRSSKPAALSPPPSPSPPFFGFSPHPSPFFGCFLEILTSPRSPLSNHTAPGHHHHPGHAHTTRLPKHTYTAHFTLGLAHSLTGAASMPPTTSPYPPPHLLMSSLPPPTFRLDYVFWIY